MTDFTNALFLCRSAAASGNSARELDLLERYVDFTSTDGSRTPPALGLPSARHLPGGPGARVQRLLVQQTMGPSSPLPRQEHVNRPQPTTITMNDLHHSACPGQRPGGAYHVCLKTGDFGKDGEPFTAGPDALGRIFVAPISPTNPS